MTRDKMSLIIAKFNRLKKNSNWLEYIDKRVVGGYQKLIDQKLLQPEPNFHFRKLFEFRYWLKHSEEEGFIDTLFCPICGEYITELDSDEDSNKAYKKGCCREHTYAHGQKLRAETCMKIYGVPHHMQNEKVCEKVIKKLKDKAPEEKAKIKVKKAATKLKKYGDPHYTNRELSKKTMLERYGVDHPTKSKEVREKIKATNHERYGCDWAIGSDEVKEKIRETNIEKYGVENPLKSEEIQQKCKESCIRNNGGLGYGSNNIRKKIENTNLERYGTKLAIENPEIRKKAEETCLKNNGVKYALQNKDIHKQTIENFKAKGLYAERDRKIKATLLERYGDENYNNREAFKETLNNKTPEEKEITRQRHINTWNNMSEEKKKEIFDKIKATNLERYGAENVFASEYGKQKIRETNLARYGVDHLMKDPNYVQKRIREGSLGVHTGFISKWEQSMVDYLRERYPDFEILQQYRDERYPYLCDCYIVDLDLFIEFNGSFYHNYRPFVESIENVAEYDDMVSKGDIYADIAEKWRYSDVEKREYAYRNGLNYLEYWEIDEDGIPFDPVERFLWEVEWCEKKR